MDHAGCRLAAKQQVKGCAHISGTHRQAMRRVGQRPSRHMVRHYRRQKTVSWRQVVRIILLGLLTIPVSMAVAIYI